MRLDGRAWRSVGLFVVLSTSLVLAGCGEPDHLQVRLGWQVNANSAGQIAALERGFYSEEGLDIELLPGGLTNPSVRTVAAGTDDLGFANGADLVISARAAGAPLRIVAAIQQRSYHAFMARAGSGITSPKDWEGKKVGVKYASPTYLLYQVLLRMEDVDRDRIEEVPLEYAIQPFLRGTIDVYPGALTNEAIAIERLGVELSVIHPADFGVDTYGNVLFTSERMLQDRPEVVEGFVRATLRGWRWALKPENAELTVDYLERHASNLDRAKELQALTLNRELVAPGGDDSAIGRIDERKLRAIVGYMREFEVIERTVDVDSLYSRRFLPPQ